MAPSARRLRSAPLDRPVLPAAGHRLRSARPDRAAMQSSTAQLRSARPDPMALASAALAVRSAASARGAAGRYNDVDGQAARRAAVGWAVMSAKKVGGVAGLSLAGLLGFVDDCARVGRMGVATEVGVGARAVPAIVDDVARVAPMADDVARVAPVRAAPGVAGEARLAPVTIADDVGVAPAAADERRSSPARQKASATMRSSSAWTQSTR